MEQAVYQRARTCPGCGQPLRGWRIGAVTAHGCDGCGGVWFDAEGLEQVAALTGEPLEATEAQFKAGIGATEPPSTPNCPVDGTPLRSRPLALAPVVTVSACHACNGVWVRDGELARLGKLVPKRCGPPALSSDDGAGHHTVLRPLPPRRCPHCDTLNPHERLRCHECGWDLDAPPESPFGRVISKHSYSLTGNLWEVTLAFVKPLGLLILLDLFWVDVEPLAWLPLANVVVWLGFHAWRVQATTTGLRFGRLLGPRFLFWSDVRGTLTMDRASLARWYVPCLIPIAAASDYSLLLGVPAAAFVWWLGGSLDHFPSPWGDILRRGLIVLRGRRWLYFLGPHYDRVSELASLVAERTKY